MNYETPNSLSLCNTIFNHTHLYRLSIFFFLESYDYNATNLWSWACIRIHLDTNYIFLFLSSTY
jgi:hypothetical protein